MPAQPEPHCSRGLTAVNVVDVKDLRALRHCCLPGF
jgi:hypothetical protein